MKFEEYQTGMCYKDFCGLNWSKILEQEGQMYLIISYDDIQEYETSAFQQAPFHVIFKTFGLVSLFMFKFADYIVDVPFNQFASESIFLYEIYSKRKEIALKILVFESSDGKLLAKRECYLPQDFISQFLELLTERYQNYGGKYDFGIYNQGINEIYNNHVIDVLYALPGDEEIVGYVVADE